MKLKRVLYVLVTFAFISCVNEAELLEPVNGDNLSKSPKERRKPLDSEGEPIGIVQSKNHGLIDSDVYFLDSSGDTIDQQRTILGEVDFPYFIYGTYLIHSEEPGYIPSHKNVTTSSTNPNPQCDHTLIPE